MRVQPKKGAAKAGSEDKAAVVAEAARRAAQEAHQASRFALPADILGDPAQGEAP